MSSWLKRVRKEKVYHTVYTASDENRHDLVGNEHSRTSQA